MALVQEQLAQARQQGRDGRPQVAMGGAVDDSEGQEGGNGGSDNTMTIRGQEIQLPPGVTRHQMEAIQQKVQSEGRESLSDAERALFGRVMRTAFGGGGGGRGGAGGRGGRPAPTQSQFQFGGEYIVFAMRDGIPTAVSIRTGLTDLDYSEIVAGLAEGDTVLVLPSASLLQSQQDFQERISRVTGGGGLGSRNR